MQCDPSQENSCHSVSGDKGGVLNSDFMNDSFRMSLHSEARNSNILYVTGTPQKGLSAHYLLKIISGHLKNGKALQIHHKEEDHQHHSHVKIVSFDVMFAHRNQKSVFMLV